MYRLIPVIVLLIAIPAAAQITLPVPGLEGTVPPELLTTVTFPAELEPLDHLAIRLTGTTTPGLLEDDDGATHQLLRGPEILLQAPEGWTAYWGATVMIDEPGADFDLVLPLEPYSNPPGLDALAGETVDIVAGIWVYLIPGWHIVEMPTATITSAELLLMPVVGVEGRTWSAVKELYR